MTQSKLSLDPENHTVRFTGTCPEVLDTCQALCCRHWDIALTEEESATGLYDTEKICRLDHARCTKPKQDHPCIQRGYRIKKKADGACLYLDQQNRCRIYAFRPILCRNFSCENGWKVSPISRSRSSDRFDFDMDTALASYTEMPEITTRLIQNPLITTKVMRAGKKNGCTLNMRLQTACRPSYLRFSGLPAKKTRSIIMALLTCCTIERSLRELYDVYKKTIGKSVKRKDFIRVIMFLLDHEILIARQFKKR